MRESGNAYPILCRLCVCPCQFCCLADCSQLALKDIGYSSPVPGRSSREYSVLSHSCSASRPPRPPCPLATAVPQSRPPPLSRSAPVSISLSLSLSLTHAPPQSLICVFRALSLRLSRMSAAPENPSPIYPNRLSPAHLLSPTGLHCLPSPFGTLHRSKRRSWSESGAGEDLAPGAA